MTQFETWHNQRFIFFFHKKKKRPRKTWWSNRFCIDFLPRMMNGFSSASCAPIAILIKDIRNVQERERERKKKHTTQTILKLVFFSFCVYFVFCVCSNQFSCMTEDKTVRKWDKYYTEKYSLLNETHRDIQTDRYSIKMYICV